jgi:hypothetical protein
MCYIYLVYENSPVGVVGGVPGRAGSGCQGPGLVAKGDPAHAAGDRGRPCQDLCQLPQLGSPGVPVVGLVLLICICWVVRGPNYCTVGVVVLFCVDGEFYVFMNVFWGVAPLN